MDSDIGIQFLEVISVVEVGDQSRVRRLPSKNAPCDDVRRRVVERNERREKTEMRFQLVVRNTRGLQAQVIADALRDITRRNALISDGMKP